MGVDGRNYWRCASRRRNTSSIQRLEQRTITGHRRFVSRAVSVAPSGGRRGGEVKDLSQRHKDDSVKSAIAGRFSTRVNQLNKGISNYSHGDTETRRSQKYSLIQFLLSPCLCVSVSPCLCVRPLYRTRGKPVPGKMSSGSNNTNDLYVTRPMSGFVVTSSPRLRTSAETGDRPRFSCFHVRLATEADRRRVPLSSVVRTCRARYGARPSRRFAAGNARCRARTRRWSHPEWL